MITGIKRTYPEKDGAGIRFGGNAAADPATGDLPCPGRELKLAIYVEQRDSTRAGLRA
jgi:hypothetical protein